jgi:6-carboxyhexanoate--CoA ligase
MRGAEGGPHEQGGRHISGGERLGRKNELHALTAELLSKSLGHARGACDFIQVVIEKLDQSDLQVISPLPVSTDEVQNEAEGRNRACVHLTSLGISDKAIDKGLTLLESAVNQRGAIILNGKTGERLDDRERKGVRVSRMDWSERGWHDWTAVHEPLHSPRIKEALALAAKVSHSPYTMAELCWSDDPDYVTGYVASPHIGYKRITHLKKTGDLCGGRIFFVKENCRGQDYIHYLEQTPVWVHYGTERLLHL